MEAICPAYTNAIFRKDKKEDVINGVLAKINKLDRCFCDS